MGERAPFPVDYRIVAVSSREISRLSQMASSAIAYGANGENGVTSNGNENGDKV